MLAHTALEPFADRNNRKLLDHAAAVEGGPSPSRSTARLTSSLHSGDGQANLSSYDGGPRDQKRLKTGIIGKQALNLPSLVSNVNPGSLASEQIDEASLRTFPQPAKERDVPDGSISGSSTNRGGLEEERYPLNRGSDGFLDIDIRRIQEIAERQVQGSGCNQEKETLDYKRSERDVVEGDAAKGFERDVSMGEGVVSLEQVGHDPTERDFEEETRGLREDCVCGECGKASKPDEYEYQVGRRAWLRMGSMIVALPEWIVVLTTPLQPHRTVSG